MASKARCCWCGSSFVRVDGTYWCTTPECRDRQVSHSIAVQNSKTGEWTFLYVPLPRQVEFDSAPVRYLLGGGAAGVSKSHMARWGLYRRCILIPGYEALILRNTWNELEKHHLRLMERDELMFRKFGIDAHFIKTEREFRINFPDGRQSIIEGGHMENPSDIDKYLSRERDAIVADEGVKFQPQPLLELSTRARSTKPEVEAFARSYCYRDLPSSEDVPGGGAVFWVLSNPGGPSAPMLREFFIDHEPNWDNYSEALREAYRPSEWGYIPGNLEDNPYLPASYERDLAVLQQWRYKQLRFNDWDTIAGQYFDEFDSKVHVADLGNPGTDVEWFRSMDWGYVSPGVCLWWACLPDGIYYIRHEYKFQLTPIPMVAENIHAQTEDLGIDPRNIRYTVIDPSTRSKYGDSGESIQETFLRPPSNLPLILGDNNRVNGWQRVRELLALRPDGRPSLIIHPSCRYLIRTFASAVSDKSNPEDVDTHTDDHPLDATRYGAMSRPSPTRIITQSNSKTFNAHRQRAERYRRRMSVRA